LGWGAEPRAEEAVGVCPKATVASSTLAREAAFESPILVTLTISPAGERTQR
jgi:hypothetical protein